MRNVALATDLIRLEILLWERVDARLRARHELPLATFEALYFVSRADGRTMRVGELAQRLRVTVGGTSKLVDRAVRAGLLTRLPDPDDRRAARVALTPAGSRTLTAATRTYEATVAELVDGALSPADLRQLHELMARVLQRAAGVGGAT